MASTDPQALLSISACINNYGPGGWPLMETTLLSDWALAKNPAAITDPAALLSTANCYNAYSAQAWLLKLGLYQNILQGLAPGMATDPQFLMFAQNFFCYNNYSPGMLPLFNIALLTDIVLFLNPAAVTDPASMLAQAGCFNNYSAQHWLVNLGLLAQISQSVNPTASTDPAVILANSGCYNNYGPGLWPLFEVQLLDLIFNNGGVTPSAPSILLETGGFILTETGGHILLE